MTAGKARPFLFTQSEAIHARSWIPLQDSPGRADHVCRRSIRVPRGLTAVMAADSLVKPEEARQGVFRFAMPQPIPSYLIALAVGDLAFRPLGPRTGVWAEPSVLDSAAYEFGDVEAMVAAIEKRFGPYRWGRYDILVLPPSFPFGGMENPKLTFATPTVLAGDRSLVSLDRARAGALVVRQPGDQRHLARLLAQRGVHHLPRAADRRGSLRTRSRRHGVRSSAWPTCARS